MATLRIAFVQGRPEFGRTEDNLERGLALAATVDAQLVILPELWSTGYVFSSARELAELAEDPRTGATAQAIAWAAKREKRWYIAGFAEAARGGRVYNSCMLVSPTGLKAVYRKLHLFEREHEWFEPGDIPLAVHKVGPAKVGMLICFDWRFPEATRALALMGADVIAHPSNLVYPNAQEAMRVRGLENRVYVVTANRTGIEKRPGGTVPFTGRSQVVSPSGEVILRAKKSEEVALAADCDLSLARNKALTKLSHLWNQRRPEFYGAITARPRARRA